MIIFLYERNDKYIFLNYSYAIVWILDFHITKINNKMG